MKVNVICTSDNYLLCYSYLTQEGGANGCELLSRSLPGTNNQVYILFNSTLSIDCIYLTIYISFDDLTLQSGHATHGWNQTSD